MDFCTMLANDFILKKVKNSNQDNVVVAPVSIMLVLNMVAAGLKGYTLEYVLGLLGSKNINKINSKSLEIMAVAADVGSTNYGDALILRPVLAMFNGAWADQRFPLKPLYKKKILKGIFDCEAKTVDFATQSEKVRLEFNAWAETVSRGFIKDFFSPGSPPSTTALLLANGLYFKGKWKHRFTVERTERRDFYLLNGRTISVPFMTSSTMYLGGSFDGFKVLIIPYENGMCGRHFSMSFFLPDKRDGLQNLLEKLIISKPERYYFDLARVELDKFWLPKFKLSYEFSVSEAMEAMGTPLSIGKNPVDFSEMIHNPKGASLGGAKIFQKACIEIDEKGTETAAITALSFPGSSSCPPKRETLSFVADHPFVFMLRESKSGLVLFTGVVLDPSKRI